MPIDTAKAIERAQALIRSAHALQNLVSRGGSAEVVQEKFEEVKQDYLSLADAVDQSAERVSFGGLIEGISDSLLEAQRNLDRQSLRYLADLASLHGAEDAATAGLATVYRIPTLKAELKFALEQVERETVNLLVYRRSTEAREAHQQSIAFEVKAVPPSPETMRRLMLRRPQLALILAPDERRDIFRMLKATGPDAGNGGVPNAANWKVLSEETQRNRVLFVRAEDPWPQGTGESQANADILVVLTHDTVAGDSRLGAWQLTPGSPPQTVRIRNLIKLSQGLEPLYAHIRAVCDMQDAFLTSLGPLRNPDG